MITILLYLVLAGINVPFALQKNNKYKALSGLAIGWNLALLLVYLAENH